MAGPARIIRPSIHAAFLLGVGFSASAAAQMSEVMPGLKEREPLVRLPRAIPECRASTGSERETGEIIICANPREQQRYRLPTREWDPDGPAQSVSRERHSLYEQGDAGIGSCSTVGPGGWTGCAFRAWKAAREQHGR